MRIELEIDERAFLHPKSREDVERELLEAGLIFWLVRREIDQARAREALQPVHKDLVAVLLSAPAVGEDSDFERIQDLGRPELVTRNTKDVARTGVRVIDPFEVSA